MKSLDPKYHLFRSNEKVWHLGKWDKQKLSLKLIFDSTSTMLHTTPHHALQNTQLLVSESEVLRWIYTLLQNWLLFWAKDADQSAVLLSEFSSIGQTLDALLSLSTVSMLSALQNTCVRCFISCWVDPLYWRKTSAIWITGAKVSYFLRL